MAVVGRAVLNTALITVAAAVLLAALAVCGLSLLMVSAGIAQCAWNGIGIAWVDANQNGSFDPGEQALQNVAVYVTDRRLRAADAAFHAVTDQRGTARLDVPISGCPAVDFEVYAEPPAGYRLTTDPRIRVKKNPLGTLQSGATYYFGFTRVR